MIIYSIITNISVDQRKHDENDIVDHNDHQLYSKQLNKYVRKGKSFEFTTQDRKDTPKTTEIEMYIQLVEYYRTYNIAFIDVRTLTCLKWFLFLTSVISFGVIIHKLVILQEPREVYFP